MALQLGVAAPPPVRRFDREVCLVLSTLGGASDGASGSGCGAAGGGPGNSRWWEKAGAPEEEGASFEAVLEDSVAAHLPSTGAAACHLVLLRCLVRPSKAPGALAASTYLRLLERFSLGRECVMALAALESAGCEGRAPLNAAAAAIACAAVERLRLFGTGDATQLSQGSFATLVTVLLGCCRRGAAAAEAAAAGLRSGGLASDVLGAVLLEVLEAASALASAAAESWSTAWCELALPALVGYGLLATAVAGTLQPGEGVSAGSGAPPGAGEALRRLRGLLQAPALDASQLEQLAACSAAWAHAFDMWATAEASGESAQATAALWTLDAEDRAALSVEPEHTSAQTEVLAWWPCRAPDSARVQLQVPAAPQQIPAASSTLHVDLYANPEARAVQDAVVAALPPGRRLEALLTAASATTVSTSLPQMLDAWNESPELCSPSLFRCNTEGAFAWPLPVVVPVLTRIVEADAKDWRSAFAQAFPSDKALFDVCWAHFCRSSEALAATFWPWALSVFCVARLASDADARDGSFAVHVVSKVAATLRADCAARSAAAEFEASLGGQALRAEASAGPGHARLAAIGDAPLAACLLSLAELASCDRDQASALTEAADEALEGLLRFVLDCSEEASAQAFNGSQVHVLVALAAQLARAISGAASLPEYGKLHFATPGPLGPGSMGAGREEEAVNGELEPDVEMALLLNLCILPEASQKHQQSLVILRRRARQGRLQPLKILSGALSTWPSRKVSALVVRVLPAILDDCSLHTTRGPIAGFSLRCVSGFPRSSAASNGRRAAATNSAHTASSGPVTASALLRSLHCMLCVAGAHLHAGWPDAAALLRCVVDVARAGAASLDARGTERLQPLGASEAAQFYELYGAFLQAFREAQPQLVGGATGADAEGPAPVIVSAGLLLRSLRVKAESLNGNSTWEADVQAKLREIEDVMC